jgi:Domain of unknown function (DUF4136)
MRNWIIVVALLAAPAPAFAQRVNVDSDAATVQTYEQGTLIVGVYDGRTKQLVWRGTGTDTLSDKPEKHTAQMNEAIAKMFEQYPPNTK